REVRTLLTVIDGPERRDDGDETHERGQDDQQQGDAVDPEIVLDAQRGDPLGDPAKLKDLFSAGIRIKAPPQEERNDEVDCREQRRRITNGLPVLTPDEEENDRRPEQWGVGHDIENPHALLVSLWLQKQIDSGDQHDAAAHHQCVVLNKSALYLPEQSRTPQRAE